MRTHSNLILASFLILLGLFSPLPGRASAPCSLKAFPTAAGFGECASGGRGGTVYYVTSFADHGPNTLRWAIEKEGPRTILFAFEGVIELESDLVIRNDDVTIIGLPYSPTITGATLIVKADNVILRHLAIKVGSQSGEIGSCQPDDGCNDDRWCNEDCRKDALYIKNVSDIMVDHLSLSWSTDEVLSADDVERVTVSNTLIAEPLHWSLKHDENCQAGKKCPFTLKASSKWKTGHGYCQRWGGSKKVSILGSLFMNCYERGLQANSDGEFDTQLLLGNSVFYDYYQHGFTFNDNDGGSRDAQLVFYNNYFVAPHAVAKNQTLPFDPPGYQNTSSDSTIDIHTPENGTKVEIWLSGNYQEGGGANCALHQPRDHVTCRESFGNLPGFLNDADPISFLSANSSQSNLAQYLQNVGRRLGGSQRDSYDQAIVDAVLSGQNRRLINSEPTVLTRSSGGHSQGCVPFSWSAPASLDTDCDGMPDAWEQSHGLNPVDRWDALLDRDGDGYNNFEEWMFSNAM